MARIKLAKRTTAAALIASAVGATALTANPAQAYVADTDNETITLDKQGNSAWGASQYLKKKGIAIVSAEELLAMNGNLEPTALQRGQVLKYVMAPAITAEAPKKPFQLSDATIELQEEMARRDALGQDGEAAEAVQVAAVKAAEVGVATIDASSDVITAGINATEEVGYIEGAWNYIASSLGYTTTANAQTTEPVEAAAPAKVEAPAVAAPAPAATGTVAPVADAAAAPMCTPAEAAAKCAEIEAQLDAAKAKLATDARANATKEQADVVALEAQLATAKAEAAAAEATAVEAEKMAAEAAATKDCATCETETPPVVEEPKAEVPAQPEKITYTTVDGDSLWKVCMAHNFSATAIFEKNPDAFNKADPHNLKKGAVLDLTGLVKVADGVDCYDIKVPQYIEPSTTPIKASTGGGSWKPKKPKNPSVGDKCVPTPDMLDDKAPRNQERMLYNSWKAGNKAALGKLQALVCDNGDGKTTTPTGVDIPGVDREIKINKYCKAVFNGRNYQAVALSERWKTECCDVAENRFRKLPNGKWAKLYGNGACHESEGTPGPDTPDGNDDGTGGCGCDNPGPGPDGPGGPGTGEPGGNDPGGPGDNGNGGANSPDAPGNGPNGPSGPSGPSADSASLIDKRPPGAVPILGAPAPTAFV